MSKGLEHTLNIPSPPRLMQINKKAIFNWEADSRRLICFPFNLRIRGTQLQDHRGLSPHLGKPHQVFRVLQQFLQGAVKHTLTKSPTATRVFSAATQPRSVWKERPTWGALRILPKQWRQVLMQNFHTFLFPSHLCGFQAPISGFEQSATDKVWQFPWLIHLQLWLARALSCQLQTVLPLDGSPSASKTTTLVTPTLPERHISLHTQ